MFDRFSALELTAYLADFFSGPDRTVYKLQSSLSTAPDY